MFVFVNIKHVIKALNQPWLIEPGQAAHWANYALQILAPGAIANPISKWANEESLPFTRNGVYVLPVNGPLMKNEYCGSPGTANMIESLKVANADPNIEAIVLQMDSPGGSVDGTKVFADAVKNSKKPVVAFIDGMMASAAMWIGSGAKERIASTNNDMVGSIGTMVQWADFSESFKQKGIAVHEAYATESTDKNKLLKEASNSGNYTELITTILDPINNEFLSNIKSNLSGKINLAKENVLTGKIYMAKDAIKHGLVDKIGTLDSAIKSAKNLASTKSKSINMETKSPFANVLAAAKAQKFELVDDIGFGLTEEQLIAVDNRLGDLTGAEATHQAAITSAAEALTAAQATITAQATAIAGLEAKVAEYAPLKAKAKADPVSGKDDYEKPGNKYLTSVDLEAQKMLED